MVYDISWMEMRRMDIFASAKDIAAAQGHDTQKRIYRIHQVHPSLPDKPVNKTLMSS